MKIYPTDLDTFEMLVLKQTKAYEYWQSNPRTLKYDFFDIVNAVRYITKTGAMWKMLPKEYPNPKTVYYHYRSFIARGFWDEINHVSIEYARVSEGQSPNPTLGIIDSQSVRSANVKSEKGIDGNKKVKGVKHTDIVDKNGFVLVDSTSSAQPHDSKLALAAVAALAIKYPWIKKLLADNAYRGKLVELAKAYFGIDIEVKISHFKEVGFRPIEKRWIVERTFAWFDNYRRLCRNYETKLETSHAMVMIASSMICLHRFSKNVQPA